MNKDNKPIIGIVGKPALKPGSMWHTLKIVDDFRYSIIKNGGLPIGVLPTVNALVTGYEDEHQYPYLDQELTKQQKTDLYIVLDMCDGLILQGGWQNDYYEVEVAKYAIEKNMPIIGCCAGFNNLAFALGGNVRRHKTEEHNIYKPGGVHEIKIEKESKLYDIFQKEIVSVNSIHKFVATDADIKSAKITAHSEDGLVEAFEMENKKFIMGIKWHPELMIDIDSKMNDLFIEFINACKNQAHKEAGKNNHLH